MSTLTLDSPILLLLVVGVPVLGALFALAMPGADRIALRQVGMGASILGGLCALEAFRRIATTEVGAPPALTGVIGGVSIGLDALSATVLLSLVVTVPVALRAGAPRVMERTQFYVVTVLFAQATIAAAVIVDAPIVRLGIASITSVPLFCLVALFGGPQRGTTTYRAALIWLGADLAALAVLVWLAAVADVSTREATVGALARASKQLGGAQPWIALALCAPGFVRLAAGPFSVWLQSFLDEAPVSAASIAAGGVAPFGALLIADIALPVCSVGAAAIAPGVAIVCAAAAVLAGVIALAERDLRRTLAQLLFLVGAVAAPALLVFDPRALAFATLHVVIAGAAASAVLICTEAIERRFESRDATGLAGLSSTGPLLAACLALALGALVGVPGVGAGRTLWGVLHATMVGPALVRPPAGISDGLGVLASLSLAPIGAVWIVLAIAGAHALAAAGAVSLLRRVFSPQTAKKKLDATRVSPWQALRIVIPVAWAFILGAASSALFALVLPAASERVAGPAARARIELHAPAPFASEATR